MDGSRGWFRKFAIAARGVVLGVRGQDSFLIHIPFAVAVFSLAALLEVELWQWCILTMCVAIVISAELFNSCIEHLAKAITQQKDRNVGEALDIASGAVLAVSIGSAVTGLLILWPPFFELVMDVLG